MTRRVIWRLGAATAALVALLAGLFTLPGLSSGDAAARGAAPTVVGTANDTSTPFNMVDVPSLWHRRYDGDGLRLTGLIRAEPTFEHWGIRYRSAGLRITGTLTVPRTTTGPVPLVVIAHGFKRPGTYLRGTGMHDGQDVLAQAGFAVLHPDYRNHAGSSIERGRAPRRPGGYPVDVLNGVRALQRSDLPVVDRIDLRRIALLGRSMGGGVALQAAVARPGLFDAVALYSPLSSRAADNFARWVRPGTALRHRVVAAYGTPGTRPRRWHRASVRNYLHRLHRRDIPVQINHGTADGTCPYHWSVATLRALRRAGVRAHLIDYPGEDHLFDRLRAVYERNLVDFFRAHV